MLYAYSEATVPKITVILRKAYGGGYIAMNSRHLGADFMFAWPGAEIAVMGPEGAANIIFKKEIEGAENPALMRSEKVKEYKKKFAKSLCCRCQRLCRFGYRTQRDTRTAAARHRSIAQQRRPTTFQKNTASLHFKPKRSQNEKPRI